MVKSARFGSFLAAACFAYGAGIRPVRFFRAGKTWFVYWLEQVGELSALQEYYGKTYVTLDVSDIKLTGSAPQQSQQQTQPSPAPQQQRQSQHVQQAPGGAWPDGMDQDIPF